MNVLSSKVPFLLVIIISYSALLSQSAIFAKEFSQTFSSEITKDNCQNNRIFHSECSFNISFQPPLTEKLECFLTFPTKTKYSGWFSSESFVLQRQVGHMCPQFVIEIKTEDKKRKGLFSSCGGTVNRVSITFYNFTLGHIFYDNKGLTDNSTTIKIQLRLETDKPCDDLESKSSDVKIDRSWIIILSAVVGFVVFLIFCAVIKCCCHIARNDERKVLSYPTFHVHNHPPENMSETMISRMTGMPKIRRSMWQRFRQNQ